MMANEFWWGGLVQDGIYMPYRERPFIRNLSKEQGYNQSAPLLLSSKGRYIWSEKPFVFHFNGDSLNVTCESGGIEYGQGYENLRGAFKAASAKYFPATGKLPDALLFEYPQYNTWIEMMYEPTQEKVIAYAKAIIENRMPPGVLIIDDNWQEDYGVWNFHPGRFPDPKSMIDTLHQLGFKVMLWVCNFISPDSLTFRQLQQKDLLVRDSIQKTALAEWWNGYSGMLDVTNKDAITWFKDRMDLLINEFGVDGFKLDSGDIDHFREGFACSAPCTANEYSEEWAKIGLEYAFNEYRACWKLGGQPIVQRLSDKMHSWALENGLGSLVPNGLAQGLMGYAFSCPDMIGGGEYKNFLENSLNLDQVLIVRNAQCAAMFPMMQFSVAPWRVLDDEHLSYCVEAAKLHERMAEEILTLARESALTGEPIIRHMDYVFPGKGYEEIIDQFMLGNDILVAPVLQKSATTKKIVFPEGEWQDENGSTIHGPCTCEVDAPLCKLPWYRRAAVMNRP